MELLERDDSLAALKTALAAAMAGHGQMVLVSGEAGIGKTTLLSHFIAGIGRAARVLKGNCDPLFTPTPLGPLYDIARACGGRLRSQLESDAPRAAIFSTLVDLLQHGPQPTVLAIEDLHWADAATLDLVRYLGRRLAPARALLVATYRADELGPQHPLRHLLGDLATAGAMHVDLARLSLESVQRLSAGRRVDVAALYRQTAGNPFFLAEVLANGAPGLPRTVRDAVLARAARLDDCGRYALEIAAVIGARMERRTLACVLGDAVAPVADCIAVGMLEATGDTVAFRHELAREAVLAGIDPVRRQAHCRRILDALRTSNTRRSNLALLAEYAEGAQDAGAVVEYGLAAARWASAAGAHREAAAQYARVLRQPDLPMAFDRAAALEAYAGECAIIDELAEASRAGREAIGLHLAAGDRAKQGAALSALAWSLVRAGQNQAAEEASRQSIEALESLAPSRALAEAYRIQAHLRMLNRERAPAIAWGQKAIALASSLGDSATCAAAQMVVGSAILVAGYDDGRPYLDRALAFARKEGLDSLAGTVYLNIGSSYGEQYRFAEASAVLEEGLAFAAERDLDHAGHYMTAWLALTRVHQGQWDRATEVLTGLAGGARIATISRIMALVALGRLRARRGDPGVDAALDEALDLAMPTQTLQRLAPVRAARAEAAWLAGDAARARAEAQAVYTLALRCRHRWHAGEMAYWRRLAGEAVEAPSWVARPYALQISGAWREAAAAWERLGCAYEQARALAEGDNAARIDALEIFVRLGAGPAASSVRQRLRGDGVRRIPRGPRPATRRNPFGLTAREMEILACVARGLTNSRIGTALGVSTKTVDHHVSAILAKLGATTRADASRMAQAHDLLPRDGQEKIAI